MNCSFLKSSRNAHCVVSIAGSVIVKIISGMPDNMSGSPSALCRTFWTPVRHFSQLMTGKYQWSFLFSLLDILCVLNSAGQNVQQCLSSLPDISRTLPDMSGMSGIFRNHRRVRNYLLSGTHKITVRKPFFWRGFLAGNLVFGKLVRAAESQFLEVTFWKETQ